MVGLPQMNTRTLTAITVTLYLYSDTVIAYVL
jgi:hypothetical protein